MNCNQFRESAQSAIENRRPLSEGAALHARACLAPDCRAAWDDLLLDRCLPAWRQNVPVVDLSERVLEEWATIPVQNPARLSAPRRTSNRWLLATAVAALVVVAVSLRPSASDPAQLLGQHRPAAAAAFAAASPSAQQISRQYVAWAEGTGSFVADAVVTVLPVSSSERTNLPVRWTGDWLRQFEPAQRKLDAALMFLEETLPMTMKSSS